jgi:type IV pilus assembly protein PilO
MKMALPFADILSVEKLKELARDPQLKRYFQGIVVLAGGLVYLVLLVIPTFIALAATVTSVKDLGVKIDTVEKEVSRAIVMKKHLDEVKADLEQKAKRLPVKKEITALLEGFASMAKMADVKILSITPFDLKKVEGAGETANYYREMPIKITAKSGYHQLGRFISQIENEQRIMIIDNLEIFYDPAAPRLHNVVIMLKTYVSLEGEKKK